MSVKLQRKINDFIDKYRVVSLCNLLSHFPYVSKRDMIAMTSSLSKRGAIAYKYPKDKNPDRTYYYSKQFNPELSNNVYDNDVIAIKKGITALETFRKYYKIVYEDLAFFPSVIRFGIESSEGIIKNVQLVYVPYSENNVMAKYIGTFFDAQYDAKYNPARYVVVEIPAMIKGNLPKEISEYIPGTRGFVLITADKMSAEFFTPDELGVNMNND